MTAVDDNEIHTTDTDTDSDTSTEEGVPLTLLHDMSIAKIMSFQTKLEMLRLASTCKKTTQVYARVYLERTDAEKEIFKDLAIQGYMKRRKWENTLAHWLITFHKVSLCPSFLVTIPPDVVRRMDQELKLVKFDRTKLPNPEKLSTKDILEKLPQCTIARLWHTKFMVDEETLDKSFHLDAAEKYKWGEMEKSQLGKLTWYIFLKYKDRITIDKHILKRIVYWNLSQVFVQLYQTRQCFNLTSTTLLPYVLLFPPELYDNILPCVADELTPQQYMYIYRNLPMQQFTYFTTAFYKHEAYQLFLRNLSPWKDADFLRWIKQERNRKFIRPLRSVVDKEK